MAFRKIKGSFKNRDITTHVLEDTYLAHDTVTGQLRIGDGVTPGGTLVTTGGSSSLTVQDEGTSLDTSATTLNFVGDGVEVTGSGATKTITISGGGGGSSDLGDLQISGSKLSVQDSSSVGVGIENIRIAGNTFSIDDSADGFNFDGHLIPTENATYDLGTENKRWKTAFLASETLDIGGATISSDGTGTLAISATGATLPEDSKVGTSKITLLGNTAKTGARPIQRVKLFTTDGSSTLTDAQLLSSTPAKVLEFNATIDTEPVYTQAGQTFTLSDGSALASQDEVTLFQF